MIHYHVLGAHLRHRWGLLLSLALLVFVTGSVLWWRASMEYISADPRLLRTFEVGTSVSAVLVSPDGRLVVAAGEDGRIWLWDAQTGELLPPVAREPAPVYGLALSPDGQFLAVAGADTPLQLWGVPKRALVQQFTPSLSAPTRSFFAVAFHPQGQFLAASDDTGYVYIWSLPDGRLRTSMTIPPLPIPREKEAPAIFSLAFTPDGAALATGGNGSSVSLWNWRTGALERQFRHTTGMVHDLALASSGTQLAAVGALGDISLWNLADPQAPALRLPQGGLQLRSIAFHPDSIHLAVGGGQVIEDGFRLEPPEANRIHIWNRTTGQVDSVLTGHTRLVTTLAFSGDGCLLASGSADGTVRLWRIGD